MRVKRVKKTKSAEKRFLLYVIGLNQHCLEDAEHVERLI